MKKWWFLGIAVMLSPYILTAFRANLDYKQRLLAAARGADRVVITPAGVATEYKMPSIELQGEAEVLELLSQFDVEPLETRPGKRISIRCACDGDFHIDAYRGDTLLVSIGYQHGENIRWRSNRWDDSDRKLKSRSAVPAWLETHGYPAMKQWYERKNR
jgi:hypothetical protein